MFNKLFSDHFQGEVFGKLQPFPKGLRQWFVPRWKTAMVKETRQDTETLLKRDLHSSLGGILFS